MAASWPVLQARLVALLPTLTGYTGVTVYDGPPLTETGVKTWVSVGHASVDNSGGSYEQPTGPVDALREETGTVLCEFVAWSGDDALPTHRAALFALVDALDAAVRADQRLGVLGQGSTVNLASEVIAARDTSGTTFRLVVSISYFTRS